MLILPFIYFYRKPCFNYNTSKDFFIPLWKQLCCLSSEKYQTANPVGFYSIFFYIFFKSIIFSDLS